MEFATEFAEALSLADSVVVLDIYGAREEAVAGVDSKIITENMSTEVVFEPDFQAVPAAVAAITHPGDLVMTMGAGSVTTLADEILVMLRGETEE